MPIEPPPTHWAFPDLATAAQTADWANEAADDADDADDLVGVGADLEPGTLLRAYRSGLFPMPVAEQEQESMLWWSPQERAILPLKNLHVSRSLRQSARTMEIRVDTAFSEVIEACADPARNSGWIDSAIVGAYTRLHELGWAHSVEAWCDGELVGGLYGVATGGLFAGESMFHRARDASKVALVGLVDLLCDGHADRRLLDVQWRTDHLASLGAVTVPRATYIEMLRDALDVPLPTAFS